MAKKEKVQEMFNGIAPKYDLLNHLLSMGIDKSWRKKAMKVVGAGRKDLVLDIACGTGDFSIEALKHGVKRVVGKICWPWHGRKRKQRGYLISLIFCLGIARTSPSTRILLMP